MFLLLIFEAIQTLVLLGLGSMLSNWEVMVDTVWALPKGTW